MKVIFSDEGTFSLVRRDLNTMHRPNTMSQYDLKFTGMTVKHLESVILWAVFSGNKSRGGLHFLFKNVIMKESYYINVSLNNLHTFWDIHKCYIVVHNDAPPHLSQ